MACSLRLKAPAKINLRLEVLGQLPNQYHLLRMFNLTVDLCDRIDISFQGREIKVEVDDPQLPSGEKNLAFKAAAYLRDKSGADLGAVIKIKKQIPAGGGLAGASSDAACVLSALAKKLGVSITSLDLEDVAYQIGADVPYLLSGGPAWVEGIGEKIQPVRKFPSPFFLIVKPDFPVSTTEVYESLGPGAHLTLEPKSVILSQLVRGDWAAFCVNHLEKVVFGKHPELSEVKSELVRLGAQAAVMSGSGSALVGIFPDQARAEGAASAILEKRAGIWARVVRQYKPRSAGSGGS